MLYIEDLHDIKLLADDSVEFIDAAAIGDVLKVKQLLDTDMHPDTQGPRGWTALRKAAVRNNYDVAILLLKRGASVDAVNYTGKTALMMASAYGHHEMASLLLLNGADPNLVDQSWRTALMFAASNGYPLVVGVLLGAISPVDLDKAERNGKTALQMAIENGHENVVKMLKAAIVHTRNHTAKALDLPVL